ncbi:MAG: hypothetical protein ACYSUI_03740, partial [Planctomycetota bacterium]
MRTVKGPGRKPVKVEKVATRGPNKGKRVLVAKREPVRDHSGKRVNRESRRWYVEYRDAHGIVRRVRGHADKGATQQLAAEL